MSINNIVGSPVEGLNFFGREKLVALAWTYIQQGNNLVFPAPRRVGKTSVGKRLITRADSKNWRTIEINLEEVDSEDAFIRLFISNLESQTWWSRMLSKSGQAVNSILERIKTKIGYGDAELTVEWKSIRKDVYEDLKNLLDHGEDTLIMVDELTVLLSSIVNKDPEQGIQTVTFFLNWLRNLRQVSKSKIRWVFCSSVGIANFCNIHGLSYTLNDVMDFDIGAFEKGIAKKLFIELSKSYDLTVPEEIITYIIEEKIKWHLPYFIQLLFSTLHKNHILEEAPFTKKEVDRAFTQLYEQDQLNTWDERLKHYGIYDKVARRILKHVSESKSGVTRNKLFDIVADLYSDTDDAELGLSRTLSMLKNDGYIIKDNSAHYLFRSDIIRGYWKNKFGE